MTVRGVRGLKSTARRPKSHPLSRSQSSSGSNMTVCGEDPAKVVVAAGSRELGPLEPVHSTPAASSAGSPDRPSLHDLGIQSGTTSEEILQREPLIRKALRIIAPQPEFLEACHLDVVDSINTIEVATACLKKDVRVLKNLHSLLVRASKLIRAAGLTPWLDLTDEIALCTRPLAAPSTGPSKQAAAVLEAAWLISKWSNKDRIAATRGNKWHRLSAILYGEKIDLFNHMREYMRATRPNSKKKSR
jgi:hypothetical protein